MSKYNIHRLSWLACYQHDLYVSVTKILLAHKSLYRPASTLSLESYFQFTLLPFNHIIRCHYLLVTSVRSIYVWSLNIFLLKLKNYEQKLIIRPGHKSQLLNLPFRRCQNSNMTFLLSENKILSVEIAYLQIYVWMVRATLRVYN